MKRWSVLSAAALVVLCSVSAFAQDAVKADPAHYKVIVDNPSVRVLRVIYKPGEKSVMHSHPESVAIFLGNAKARFTMPDGKSEEVDAVNETAQYTPPQTHNPANIGTTPIDVIVVELKKTPGTATLPATREGIAMKVLAEGARASVIRSTADASFQEPAGTTHDYDQLVIALGPSSQMALSIDGKPVKMGNRGDVAFIPRGTKHESKNTGGKPIDFIIVAIK